jgi:predicted dehydrogenase
LPSSIASPGAYPSYEALISDPEIELVYNPLPNSLHCEWSIRALRAGKAVLCEKPLAANAAEAARIAETARSTGRPFMEAFHYRHHPVADRIRDIVGSGALGALRSVEARFLVPPRWVGPENIRLRFELGGGAAMDPGCYCVNLLRMIVDEEPLVVGASAILATGDIDVAMEANLRFPGGCIGRIACSLNHPANHWEMALEVLGEHGTLEVINPFLPHAGHAIRLSVDGRSTSEELDRTSTYACQLRETVRVMREGAPIRTTAEDGVATMRVVDDIYRAAGMRLRGT